MAFSFYPPHFFFPLDGRHSSTIRFFSTSQVPHLLSDSLSRFYFSNLQSCLLPNQTSEWQPRPPQIPHWHRGSHLFPPSHPSLADFFSNRWSWLVYSYVSHLYSCHCFRVVFILRCDRYPWIYATLVPKTPHLREEEDDPLAFRSYDWTFDFRVTFFTTFRETLLGSVSPLRVNTRLMFRSTKLGFSLFWPFFLCPLSLSPPAQTACHISWFRASFRGQSR